jgi:predicted MFS family arabinose efflux permease
MSSPSETNAATADQPSIRRVTVVLGVLQILGWGTTFYLLAVLAKPIAAETGWSYERVLAGVSVGMLVAGLVSPRVGRAIASHGGRPVLAAAAGLSALGLALIGSAQNFTWYLAGWAVLGLGMGAGLYDAAFSTLGVIYGGKARNAISVVTLFGGFASTVCWPISAWLVEHAGWRAACFTYAAAYLLLALPLYIFALPRSRRPASEADTARQAGHVTLNATEWLLFLVLALILTLKAAVMSSIGAHLVILLTGQGLTLAQAVALGMIIGPAAVGARFVETLAGHRYHPIWTMTASTALMACGLPLFFADIWLYGAAIALYAAGSGIGSIARGTLPLALFGPTRYPVLLGRLGLPSLVAMALAPVCGALVYERAGATGLFAVLSAITTLNLVLMAVLWGLRLRLPSEPSGSP